MQDGHIDETGNDDDDDDDDTVDNNAVGNDYEIRLKRNTCRCFCKCSILMISLGDQRL